MERSVAAVLLALVALPAPACETCRPLVRATVYDGRFLPTLGLLSAPLLVVAAIGTFVYRSDRFGSDGRSA